MTKLPSSFARHLKPVRQQRPTPVSAKAALEDALQAAKAHHRDGNFAEAEKICISILARDPANVGALMLAGSLAWSADDLGLALVFFRKAVAIQPKAVQGHMALATASHEAQEYEDAISHFQRAMALKPNMLDAIASLARTYAAAGQVQPALELFKKAAKLAPNDPSIRYDHANALIDAGRMEDAAALLRENIARAHHVALSYKSLVETRRFTSEPAELGDITARLAQPDLPPDEKMWLHQAAGKILNDIGRYGEAIDHFQSGKLIKGSGFDIEAFRRRVDTLIAAFTPALLKSKAGIGDPSEVPVFVLGMPRSGTTLVEQICASHPSVYGAGEIARLATVIRSAGYAQAPDGTIQESPHTLTAAKARSMAADYLDFVRRLSPGSARVVDKMPHNFQYVGMIALLFPNARIIHCARDPIDNCVSCFFTTFNDTHGYNADLANLGLYYREYDRLMRHWKSVLPDRIHECSYEALIADQETETRRLIEFLGLPWDDACLRFHETERTVTTPSRWQVRQPIYKTSVKRWKNYENKIQPLIDALGDLAKV